MSETDFSERTNATEAEDAGLPVEVNDRPEVVDESPSEEVVLAEADEAAAIAERAEAGDEAAQVALDETGGAEPKPVPDEVAAAETEHLELEAESAPEDDVTDVPTEEATLDEAAAEVDAPEAEAEPEAEPEPELQPEPEPKAEPQPEAEAGEPEKPKSAFDGPGDWYVIHTYAGYENKVKANLQSRIGSMQMEEKIFDVVIPMEDVMEIKGGKRQVVQKKVFPGYLLVKMVYDNDSWYVVRNTPGVTGFVSSGTGTKPTPLSRREVDKILAVKQETQAKPQYRLEWEENDVVRIIAGPFADFTGTIAEINVEQSKLKVMVNIFDRETPVELAFDQVAKA
jgi:transcriptional antiterminator NusG